MYQLGITGGIGSGKTLVCSVLEKLGAAIYNADSEAKKLMSSDTSLINQIKELFGEEAYSGTIVDRAYLARQVFGDPQKLAQLNAVVHPAVRSDFTCWVKSQYDAAYVVEEAAILFESGANRFMNGTVLVHASEKIRIERVVKRDGVDEASVKRRMKHQMADEEKKKLVDHVIYNDDTEMLLPQIISLHEKILNSR